MLTPKRGSEVFSRTRDDQRQFGRQMPKLPPSIRSTVRGREQHRRSRAGQTGLDLIEAHDDMSSAPGEAQPVVKTTGQQGFDPVGQTIQNRHRLPGRTAEQSFLNRLVYHIPASTQPHTASRQPFIDIREDMTARIDHETDQPIASRGLARDQAAAFVG